MVSCVKMVAVFLLVATTLLLVTFDSIYADDTDEEPEEFNTEESGGSSHDHEHFEGDGHTFVEHQGLDLDQPLEEPSGPEPKDSGEADQNLAKFQKDELNGLEGDNDDYEHEELLKQRLAAGPENATFKHTTCHHGINKKGQITHKRITTHVKNGKVISKTVRHFVNSKKTGIVKRISNKYHKGNLVGKTLAHVTMKDGKKGRVHVHELNGNGKKLNLKGAAKAVVEHNAKVKEKMANIVYQAARNAARKSHGGHNH